MGLLVMSVGEVVRENMEAEVHGGMNRGSIIWSDIVFVERKGEDFGEKEKKS